MLISRSGVRFPRRPKVQVEIYFGAEWKLAPFFTTAHFWLIFFFSHNFRSTWRSNQIRFCVFVFLFSSYSVTSVVGELDMKKFDWKMVKYDNFESWTSRSSSDQFLCFLGVVWRYSWFVVSEFSLDGVFVGFGCIFLSFSCFQNFSSRHHPLLPTQVYDPIYPIDTLLPIITQSY